MIAADLMAEAARPAMNHDAHLSVGQPEGRCGFTVIHLPDDLDLEEVITGSEAADLPRAPVQGAVTDLAWLGAADGASVLAPDQVTLVAVALADRKRRLGHLIDGAGIARLRHSETFEDGERLLAECDRRGLEGVVAKHKNGIYRSGRSTSWVKVKCTAWREANRKRGGLFGEGRTSV